MGGGVVVDRPPFSRFFMKISKLFHWLYFVVMMLPIFIFPIFALAVRSDNNFQPISIEVQENEVVNYNQWFTNANTTDNAYGASISYNDYLFTVNGTVSLDYNFYDFTISNNSFYLIENHKYYFKGNSYVDPDILLFILAGEGNNPSYFTTTSQGIFTCDTTNNYWFKTRLKTYFLYTDKTWYAQLTDLTQMFGAGNEPSSVAEYLSMFPNAYYEFTQGSNVLLEDQVVSYSDTDVGSQMVYLGYRVVDNYFNYDNVFNFGTLYSWLVSNFFTGAAPLGFFIFWHLLIYWLLTSLLWLLFDVLLYVPNLIHRWLDKASLS